MRTAVLIVSYNTREDLHGCLESLLATGCTAAEIYVADNGSEDGSAAMVESDFPYVNLIRNETNENYARATNQLIETAAADFYLLLNPDTRPDYRALAGLVGQFRDHPAHAAVAPQLRYPDGRIQPSCRRLPNGWTPWREVLGKLVPARSSWKMRDFDHATTRTVLQPMFSAIWISRRAFKALGLLDEAYPLFMNDVDWCRRAYEAGWDIVFDPSVAVTHGLGGTTRRYRWRKLWYSHWGMARYLWRSRSSTVAAVIGVLGLWLFLIPRAVATLFKK